METKLLDIKAENDSAINTAAQILKNGGIVAVPTETVYGLAASAFSDNAIKNVFTAKGRPQDNPLIVHISDMDMLYTVAKDIPQCAIECAKRFWPGPFTMVLKKTNAVCGSVSAGLDTVAVRMPSDKICQSIISKSGIPLAAPSANRSGSPSPTTYSHVLSDLNGKIDAIIMGDNCTFGIESTVVAINENEARLLRPGAVTLEQLKEVLPDIIVDKAVLSEVEKGDKVASPGMKYKHYAPKAELYLIEGETKEYCDFVNGKNDGVAVCFAEEENLLKTKCFVYGSQNDPLSLAHSLFETLRTLDAQNIEKGYVHSPQKNGVGLAVYNRLIRACAYRVIKL